MVRKLILTALMGVAGAALGADTSNAIFEPTFKSLQVTDPSNLLGQPIIHLSNPASKVRISFDELAEDNRFLRYRLVHCDSDWRPSAISDLEYIDGFNEADIYSWALSEQTLTHYVHYDLELPNEDIVPKLSGNYLVEIYDQDDPSTTLLQARFMVSEDGAGVAMEATSRTDVDNNASHQQLAIELNLEGSKIEDPFNELRVVVTQNNRPDLTRVLEKPLRVAPNSAIYEHQKELIFPAGNEYRRFDTSNLRYPLMGVERFDYVEPLYHATLRPDAPRPDERYVYDQDQAGRYFVDELNATTPEIGADYVVTHFTLESPRLQRDVFIDGDMVLRRRDSDSRMVYDETLGAYVKTLLLKQGLYNYQYITDGGGTAAIEGNHYETGNEYTVLVYYRPYAARYDRLIATGFLNTTK